MIDIPSIKIFACDYRKITDKWDLPFIRLGDNHSNAKINIHSDYHNDKYRPWMSEMDKIFWVAENIEEFGKTDYIGFCGYRRFFAFINKPIINIPDWNFDRSIIMSPEHILSFILNQKSIGASMFPINIIDDSRFPEYKYIWEQIYHFNTQFEKDDSKLLKAQDHKKMFDIYLSKFNGEMKEAISKSFQIKQNYLCNIFVLRKDLFKQFADAASQTLIEFHSLFNDEIKKNLHPRYLGFQCERLVSCYLHAQQILGNNITHLPLLTINTIKHNEVIKDKNGMNIEKEYFQ